MKSLRPSPRLPGPTPRASFSPADGRQTGSAQGPAIFNPRGKDPDLPAPGEGAQWKLCPAGGRAGPGLVPLPPAAVGQKAHLGRSEGDQLATDCVIQEHRPRTPVCTRPLPPCVTPQTNKPPGHAFTPVTCPRGRNFPEGPPALRSTFTSREKTTSLIPNVYSPSRQGSPQVTHGHALSFIINQRGVISSETG